MIGWRAGPPLPEGRGAASGEAKVVDFGMVVLPEAG
jgi:hypothetical protein